MHSIDQTTRYSAAAPTGLAALLTALLLPLWSPAKAANADQIQNLSEVQALSETLPTVLEMLNERKQVLRSKGVPVDDHRSDTPEPAAPADSRRSGEPVPALPSSGYRDGLRNPFGITPSLARALTQRDNGGELLAYQRSDFIARLPKLKLRGVINKRHDPTPIALLDIDNEGVHMVRVGDRISFNPADPKQVIRIKQIDRLSVVVEVGTLGDLIVVR